MSEYDRRDPGPARATEAKDLEALRTGLAELSPSPDLADAVASIARDAPDAARHRPGPGRWAWLLPAAAALVVAAVLVFRGGAVDPVAPPGEADGEGRARVVIPPTARQVAAARRANAYPALEDGGTLPLGFRSSFEGGGLFEMWTDGYLAPIPKARQRWVVRREEGIPARPEAVRYLSFPQEEGVLLLGPELLVPDDAMIRGAGGELEVLTKQGTWRPVEGTHHLELTLGSPDKGGAATRVRCVLSTAYTGTLLVSEPLSRALGLHHFELPGGMRASLGDSEEGIIAGQRALARVRIPELRIDRVVEVQVRGPHHPRSAKAPKGRDKKLGARPRDGAVVVTGALPDQVVHCDELSFAEDGDLVVHMEGTTAGMTLGTAKQGDPLEVGIWADGPLHLGLVYEAKGDRPRAVVVLGAYDFGQGLPEAYRFPVEWVELRRQDAPGARVTIAKVWRGLGAHVSDEAVVVTQVAPDGRIRFPRVKGEPGSTLRMHIEREDGSSFHDVALERPEAPGARINFHVRPDGTVVFAASSWDALGDPRGAVAGIQAEIGEWVADGKRSGRFPDPSMWTIDISGERDAPWQAVQCVLLAAAQSDVRKIRHFSPGSGPGRMAEARYVDNELAADRGAQHMPGPIATPATVTVHRSPGGGFELRLHFDLPRVEAGSTDRFQTATFALDGTPDAELRARLQRAVNGAVEGKPARLRTLPATQRAPYHAIQLVIEALRAAGATQVVFEGPMPASVKDR